MKLPRRSLLMSALLAAPVLQAAAAAAEEAKEADFLFVQTAKGMTFDKASSTLTLVDVSSMTVMFADRPERVAGNMKTTRFVPFWSEGKDSFLKDPPNADISILEDGTMRQVVATLEKPELKDGNLSYTVKIIQGEMPESGADVSVFIDIIGMPLTPVSYAGVARRSFRRAVIY
ncbi:hypothetical protein [Aestuariivirga sp.]|uniref:hypothetical protein n=1 Tax=Aestuariivirga sp. TaxID=2650926 RepID=UPI00391D073F